MWRRMQLADLDPVAELGNAIHADYYEDPKVFAERFRLYPEGCFVFVEGKEYLGYGVTHPWMKMKPPALDSFIKEIPIQTDTYYIHDIALAAAARGNGAASKIVELIKHHARDNYFSNVTLVAVNHSAEFWARHGFKILDDPTLTKQLQSYDANSRYMMCAL